MIYDSAWLRLPLTLFVFYLQINNPFVLPTDQIHTLFSCPDVGSECLYGLKKENTPNILQIVKRVLGN